MKRHLNTLFLTTPGTYLARRGETVLVRRERETLLRTPIHLLGGIVCFGPIACSPALMDLCAQKGVSIVFLSSYGRFVACVEGPRSGNVLLRRTQYRRADQPNESARLASAFVSAKLLNCRTVLRRAARNLNGGAAKELDRACRSITRAIRKLQGSELDSLRGLEGDAARTYFQVFGRLIRNQRQAFAFRSRSRRPPLDPINALLSFLYVLLTHDAASALEAAGLDPAVGFLHQDRPGRPGLALDLVEEFRPVLGDRLAISLINRRQIKPSGFDCGETGAVLMNDQCRKTVLTAYQMRKQETIRHPFLGEQTTVGLLPHLQARLLARHLRGDLDAYPPFIQK